MNELETKLLEAAGRRGISVRFDAGLHQVDRKIIRAAINKLLRKKLIYPANRSRPNFWGGATTEYRKL